MNKDKAIQLLERLQDPEPYEPHITSEAFEALQMAIDALSADGDTISRQAAIDALYRECRYGAVIDHCGLETAMDIISELPPAQPERIRGHWVNGHCDKCNEHAPFWAMASTYYESNFCPNCGADMREVTT